jgi:hypothetical protein
VGGTRLRISALCFVEVDPHRSITRVLTIPEVMTLKTLAEVRTLLGHLPKATPLTHQPSTFDAWRTKTARATNGTAPTLPIWV